MIGVSYDGSTPWQVAAAGNPYLKAIVPVAGLPDAYDLMFHNGSAEVRGAAMHYGVYWLSYGFEGGWPNNMVPEVPNPLPVPIPIPPLPTLIPGGANGRTDQQNMQSLVCQETYESMAVGFGTHYSGDRLEEVNPYWAERNYRQRVLDNYDGAVFLIHGLQDWNVDPHSAIPFNAELRAAGIETKEWYGQWGHALPDTDCPISTPRWVTPPCRLDFAEVLFRFFEKHLKEKDVDDGPDIQVQDDLGYWRNADSYPPADPEWLEFKLNAAGTLGEDGGPETAVTLEPARTGGPSRILEFKTDFFDEDVYISGLPQVKLPFEINGPGGELGVWLMDEDANGSVRAPTVTAPGPFQPRWLPAGVPVVGHAQMNVHFYNGGDQRQTLHPGERYVAQIEMDPLEVRIPAGHRLTLWVFQYHYPDHGGPIIFVPGMGFVQGPAPPAGPIDVFLGEDAILRLPTLDLDPTTVFPVPGANFPDMDLAGMMHMDKPLFTGGLPLGLACPGGLDGARLEAVRAASGCT
jgi:predicted acyl esterase